MQELCGGIVHCAMIVQGLQPHYRTILLNVKGAI